jgi:outer membrane protein TolC
MEWNNLLKKLEAANKSAKAASKQFDALIRQVRQKARDSDRALAAAKRKIK